jgi:hypothetical protein
MEVVMKIKKRIYQVSFEREDKDNPLVLWIKAQDIGEVKDYLHDQIDKSLCHISDENYTVEDGIDIIL